MNLHDCFATTDNPMDVPTVASRSWDVLVMRLFVQKTAGSDMSVCSPCFPHVPSSDTLPFALHDLYGARLPGWLEGRPGLAMVFCASYPDLRVIAAAKDAGPFGHETRQICYNCPQQRSTWPATSSNQYTGLTTHTVWLAIRMVASAHCVTLAPVHPNYRRGPNAEPDSPSKIWLLY